jgi:hypothetical protein
MWLVLHTSSPSHGDERGKKKEEKEKEGIAKKILLFSL